MRHLIVGLVVALVAWFLDWLLLDDTSPLDEYFLWHVEIPNHWRALNAIPYILGAIMTHGHAGPEPVVYLALQFIQWFTVGFVLSFIYSVFRRAWLRPLR